MLHIRAGARYPCDLCHEEGAADGHPALWAQVEWGGSALWARGLARVSVELQRPRRSGPKGPAACFAAFRMRLSFSSRSSVTFTQRMVCGFCSLEQRLSLTCAACGRTLAGTSSNPSGELSGRHCLLGLLQVISCML
jgi:hypothetical protein